jgi:hypothetical protein
MICHRINCAVCWHALLTAAVVGLLAAFTASAYAEEVVPSGHLSPGSVLARSLVPPGWIAEHLAGWVSDHPAYRASCQTTEVEGELRYLETLVDRDQELRDTARSQLIHAVVDGNSTAKRHTDVAINALAPLDNDITAIDRLLVRLIVLPSCATTTMAPDVAAVPLSGLKETLSPNTPAAETAVASAAPQAQGTQQATAAPRDDNVFIIRFDSKLPALTPSGARMLDAALIAAKSGHNVRILIEGCENRDSAPNSTNCANRTRSLERMLAQRGLDHPARLFAQQR